MAAQYRQGHVLYLYDPIPLPDGTFKEHPVLIISSNRANSYESFYTAVMLTHHIENSVFSFELHDMMFDRPLNRSAEKPRCFARTYITISFKDSDVKSFNNNMKEPFLKMLLNQIKDSVFVVD
jgi:hypothetical protein